MKKLLVPFGLIALVMVLGAYLIAQAQPAAGPAASGPGPKAELAKSRMLISLDRAALSLEQLQQLQGIVQDTMAARDAVLATQDSFQEFLLNWTGSSQDFETALEAEQQKVKAAVEALRALQETNAGTLKDALSASQFEALSPVLGPVVGPARTPERGAGPQGGPSAGRGRGGPGRLAGRGAEHGRPAAFLRGLDLLNEVISEKIGVLQGA